MYPVIIMSSSCHHVPSWPHHVIMCHHGLIMSPCAMSPTHVTSPCHLPMSPPHVTCSNPVTHGVVAVAVPMFQCSISVRALQQKTTGIAPATAGPAPSKALHRLRFGLCKTVQENPTPAVVNDLHHRRLHDPYTTPKNAHSCLGRHTTRGKKEATRKPLCLHQRCPSNAN